MTMNVLINIDVPDLTEAIGFYTRAFGLSVTRRLGADVVEFGSLPVWLYLLQKPAGSQGAGNVQRGYDRHWTPVHFDLIIDELEQAVLRAVGSRARQETKVRVEVSSTHRDLVRSVRPRLLPDPIPRRRVRRDRLDGGWDVRAWMSGRALSPLRGGEGVPARLLLFSVRVVHVELDRVRVSSKRMHLFHLQLDVAVDEVVIEHAAGLQEGAVLVEVGQRLAQRAADLGIFFSSRGGRS